MEAIFDRNGYLLAWMHQGAILDLYLQHRAFVQDEGIYSFSGRQLGYFVYGFLGSLNGEALAFVQGAQKGPQLPATKPFVLPPAGTASLPFKPQVALMPTLEAWSPYWSSLTWDEFLSTPGSGRDKRRGKKRYWRFPNLACLSLCLL